MTNITLDGLPTKTGTISDAGIIHYREGGVDKKMTVANFLARISEEYSSDINAFLAAADKAAGRIALGIARRTTVNNADYAILSTDKVVAQIGTMSAARTFTLPAAALYPAGEELIVVDQSGTVTNSNKITVSRTSTDTIDGVTSIDILYAYGFLKLISDGVSNWKISSSLSASQSQVNANSSSSSFVSPLTLASKQLNVAKITHQLASGTSGGGSTGLTWSTRPLNTISINPNSIVTLSSNQFTLQAGTYKISAFQSLTYNGVDVSYSSTSRIRNITDSTTPTGGVGVNSSVSEVGGGVSIPLYIQPFILTIAASKTFELQYYTTVSQASIGLGEAASSGEVETYASVYIEKI